MQRILITLILSISLASCGPADSKLEQVRTADELVVITVNSPTTYYEGSDQYVGFEYDMAKAFADYLGVKLKVVVVKRFAEVLPALQDGRGDLAAAGITVTDERKKGFRFSLPYQYIYQQLVYRFPGHKPRDYSDLQGRDIAVVAGSSYAARL
ncbi:MAG: transporter substrate-binding domain-containing protein, partial [Acidiferrobacterales bacterium]|nr:transporter substrate-binding domain-containing protein [Acidiferrobacterales bacterium]